MLFSIYINKNLIFILIYCVFKILLYISISKFFSSFLPALYIISISKLFSFILYIFHGKIMKKIQSIENANNNANEIRNEEQLINPPQQNIIRRTLGLLTLRQKLMYLFLMICASILEVIFYASFNKMYKDDSIGKKRSFYYLTNNKLCFLLEISFIYLIFYKKCNNNHNLLSLFSIFFSQIAIYILDYEENDKSYKLLLYGYFLNIIYATQNIIEKELNNNQNLFKIPIMVIMGNEGIFELIIIIVFTIGIKFYYGISPISDYIIDASITFKYIFLMLCILLSEYVRIGTLNKYDPFYICFYEEIIYIFFSLYYNISKELKVAFFHIIIIISFFIFIEVIELNFCGLNHNTRRYLRERDNLNDILEGIANISSLSTGSHSDSTGGRNNNDLIRNNDIFNNDINNNDINIIIGKLDKDGDLMNEDKKNLEIKDNKNNINVGKILDEDDDVEESNVFKKHLIE